MLSFTCGKTRLAPCHSPAAEAPQNESQKRLGPSLLLDDGRSYLCLLTLDHALIDGSGVISILHKAPRAISASAHIALACAAGMSSVSNTSQTKIKEGKTFSGASVKASGYFETSRGGMTTYSQRKPPHRAV